jgi:hypothetical protein
MRLAKLEQELAERASRFLKAELKRARDSVAAKLKRETFAAIFLLVCLAALELEGVRLEDI